MNTLNFLKLESQGGKAPFRLKPYFRLKNMDFVSRPLQILYQFFIGKIYIPRKVPLSISTSLKNKELSSF
jgi:hypothetical protein